MYKQIALSGNASPLNQFIVNVELAIGLKRRIKNGEVVYERWFTTNDESDAGHKQPILFVSKRMSGYRPKGKMTPFEADITEGRVVLEAHKLLGEPLGNGATLFEGGVTAWISVQLIRILRCRLRLANGEDDIRSIFISWRFAVLEHDYLSNERSTGTVRTSRKAHSKGSNRPALGE